MEYGCVYSPQQCQNAPRGVHRSDRTLSSVSIFMCPRWPADSEPFSKGSLIMCMWVFEGRHSGEGNISAAPGQAQTRGVWPCHDDSCHTGSADRVAGTDCWVPLCGETCSSSSGGTASTFGRRYRASNTFVNGVHIEDADLVTDERITTRRSMVESSLPQ